MIDMTYIYNDRRYDLMTGRIDRVKEYWGKVNTYIDNNELPPIGTGDAPVYNWECNPKYCKYFDVCGGGIKGV